MLIQTENGNAFNTEDVTCFRVMENKEDKYVLAAILVKGTIKETLAVSDAYEKEEDTRNALTALLDEIYPGRGLNLYERKQLSKRNKVDPESLHNKLRNK